jgi:hypothetical protein
VASTVPVYGWEVSPSIFLAARFCLLAPCLLALELWALLDWRLIFCCCLDCVRLWVEESSTADRGWRGLMFCLPLLSSPVDVSLCQSAVSKNVTSLSPSMDATADILGAHLSPGSGCVGYHWGWSRIGTR